MKLYNTQTRKEEEFKPLKQEEVKVYFCGPTVYNYAHIGNLRAYVFSDIVLKSLKFLGYNVKSVMNITDVDDKTIRDSQAAGENLKDFTEKYTEIFLNDIQKLGITQADNVVPVTTLIPEMVRMIQTMLNRKNAYLADDGSIYFDVKSYKKYGKLANLDTKGMKSSVRIDNDEYEKENVADFVLWKNWKESDGENFWEETFSVEGKDIIVKGRPGWHIECSACNMKYFGAQIDIHMGGCDLIFPHHQNEIAQTESCTRKEFSKYWLHSGHITVEGKKMSKSAGNFYTLTDIEKKYSDINPDLLYRAIRLGYMNAKYKDSVDFSFDKIEANINTVKKIDESLKNLSRSIQVGDKKPVGISRDFRNEMQIIVSEYMQRLEDDINMPEALAEFHSFVKFTNTGIADGTFALEEEMALMDMFETFNSVLGIIDFDILENSVVIADDILDLLDDRNKAKLDKNFELADSIRDTLTQKGYKIIDGREGSVLEKI
ncbi:MAG: cysteine--tRNA ligase [Candidatus Gracilibacteria bacterium]|nr:cysteine--tRNA ligase [Candidatus Gracilibacteria bacterium]